MNPIDVTLITPDKHKPGQRPPAEIAKARIRPVLESIFSNPKGQMRLDHHLAKTHPGLVQRIAQRLLALTLAIPINVLTGRPPARSPRRPAAGRTARRRSRCRARRRG